MVHESATDLKKFLHEQKFATVMADPPWRFPAFIAALKMGDDK